MRPLELQNHCSETQVRAAVSLARLRGTGGVCFPTNALKAASQLFQALRQGIPLVVHCLYMADATRAGGIVQGVHGKQTNAAGVLAG